MCYAAGGVLAAYGPSRPLDFADVPRTSKGDRNPMRRGTARAAALVALVTLVSLAVGCGKKESSDARSGPAIARVNGAEIHEADVTREVNHLVAVMGPAGTQVRSDAQQMAQLRTNAVQNLVDRVLLIEHAKNDNLMPTDEDVKVEMDRVRAAYPDSASFLARLNQLSMSVEDVQTEIRTNLCIRRLVEKNSAGIPSATKEDAAKYYQDNPTEFVTPDEVRASHILIAAAETEGPEARAAAHEKAAKVLAELRGGRDFAEAAKEHSGDPGSAANGGDLGFFTRGRMVPEFEQSAFSLKVGEISDVFDTGFGSHILKVTDRRDSRTLPLDEVQDKIVEYLDRTKGDRAIRSLIEDARTKAKIEVLDDTAKG